MTPDERARQIVKTAPMHGYPDIAVSIVGEDDNNNEPTETS